MKNSAFVESLKLISSFQGDKERQVEFAYNNILKTYFSGISISNPYKCDGYFETDISGKKTRIICEYKYDYDLSKKVVRSQVLAQVLFYLKKFEKDGKPFPNVILVGDSNECFVIHSNDLLKWLDFENVDWSLPASSARNCADLIAALANDDERNAFVFSINDGFDFKNVYDKICDYATNVTRLIRITEHNVDKVFNVFEKIVKDKVSANDNNLDDLYQDAHTSSERFVYNKLQTIKLSPEAQVVYDKACELVRNSMKYRALFDDEHPEYQLTKCWDAGWYQIKAMLKQYMSDELKEFKELQKKLANKMRPMIYTLGFLKK